MFVIENSKMSVVNGEESMLFVCEKGGDSLSLSCQFALLNEKREREREMGV